MTVDSEDNECDIVIKLGVKQEWGLFLLSLGLV